jgi:hypothetical protein
MREIIEEQHALEQQVVLQSPAFFEVKAAELLASGSVIVATTAGTVNGHIRRFRRGDFVIEVDHSRIDGRGHGSTRARLVRHAGDRQTAEVVRRLAHAVVGIGPDAQPMT